MVVLCSRRTALEGDSGDAAVVLKKVEKRRFKCCIPAVTMVNVRSLTNKMDLMEARRRSRLDIWISQKTSTNTLPSQLFSHFHQGFIKCEAFCGLYIQTVGVNGHHAPA